MRDLNHTGWCSMGSWFARTWGGVRARTGDDRRGQERLESIRIVAGMCVAKNTHAMVRKVELMGMVGASCWCRSKCNRATDQQKRAETKTRARRAAAETRARADEADRAFSAC